MATFDKTTKSDGLEEKLVHVTRTSKTIQGGRKFTFAAVCVVGDKNGRIGVGRGKAAEVPVAIQKALESARRNMVTIELNGTTIWHEIESNYGASSVFMKPALEGTGIIAGGAMRPVFEVLGVQNILAKCIGSTNPHNVIQATINGLTTMLNPEVVAARRGKSINEINDEVGKHA